MPQKLTEAEKEDIRKMVKFIVACGLKIVHGGLQTEDIFNEAEEFVKKAEERYGLPMS